MIHRTANLSQKRRIRKAAVILSIIILFLAVVLLLAQESSSPVKTPDNPTVTTDAPPSTEPKGPEAKAAHSVPASHPRQLIIPKIGINANIHPVSLTHTGSIDAPTNAWDIGWYTKSSPPGMPGSILLDGHVNDALSSPGVFANLHTLQAGDEISIERGDKMMFTYHVTSTEQVPLKNVPMKELLKNEGTERAVLITCGGTYDKGSQTYSDRVIIQAQREV